MSNYQQRDMSGALFKNDKGGNEARPDYRGDLVINGETYEIAGWIKSGQKGKFMSLSAKPKEEPKAAPAPAPHKPHPQGWQRDDSDIPF